MMVISLLIRVFLPFIRHVFVLQLLQTLFNIIHFVSLIHCSLALRLQAKNELYHKILEN